MVSSHEAEEAEPMINEISDEKIDRVLSLLHEADPTSPETDAVELPGAFFRKQVKFREIVNQRILEIWPDNLISQSI